MTPKKTDFERINKFMRLKHEQKSAPTGTKINGVILVIDRKLHDSGYPFLHAYGYNKETETLYDMGWHDHFLIQKQPVNMDSFGSNIIHIYPWRDKDVWTSSAYYVSSFELTEGGILR